MKKPVLVIMAAGMGSRYGGLKQIDSVDDYGNKIIDYSIYDAVKAGFAKIIFIIKKEIEDEFRKQIGDRISTRIPVEYVFQETDALPDGFSKVPGRTKPWGTGHAIWCCKDVIDGPFAVINADDYYGQAAFQMIYDKLVSYEENNVSEAFCMVGYRVDNTLTENGHVSRGVCEVSSDNKLVSVTERTRIEKRPDGVAYTEDEGKTWTYIDPSTTVSMNLWGFTKSLFCNLTKQFEDFLTEALNNNPLKAEFYITSIVQKPMDEGRVTVDVMKTPDKWFGVTYKEDKEKVVKAIAELKRNGIYNETLWDSEISKEVPAAVLDAYDFEGKTVYCDRYGSGHINDTYLVSTVSEEGVPAKRFILQRMNGHVFKHPDLLMENVLKVTEHIKKKIEVNGGDSERETLNVVTTKEGRPYFVDLSESYWRVYRFVEDSLSYDTVSRKEDFYQSAFAFGSFQRLLSDFDATTLFEVIPDFHNTPKRYEAFKRAVEENKSGRAGNVSEEIAFVNERAKEMGIVAEMIKEGKMPLRVTHNDTKLNNVLIDAKSGKGLCVIDLDTVMPGAAVFDFGDSIRFGANTASEDEKDLSKVSLSLELFEEYAKGFLEGCGGSLTKEELKMLPMGAKIMTFECGMRFLTDYIDGDVYFKTAYPEHNLVRCRTQFELVKDMERKYEQMEEIVEGISSVR